MTPTVSAREMQLLTSWSLLEFWQVTKGGVYNPHIQEAPELDVEKQLLTTVQSILTTDFRENPDLKRKIKEIRSD